MALKTQCTICVLQLALSASVLAQSGEGQDTAPYSNLTLCASMTLTPASLVAAGVDPQGVATLLAAIQGEDECASISVLAESEHDAALDVSNAVEVMQTGASASFGTAECNEAIAILSACQAASIQAHNNLFTASTVSLEPHVLTRLNAWQGSIGFSVPPEFRVVARSSDEWRVLARAIRAERRAIRTGETLDEQSAQLLSEARASQDVIDAKSRLETHLDAAQSAFVNPE